MAADDRIERLVDRHEALAQNVELIAHNVNRMVSENHQMASKHRKVKVLVSQMAEGIVSLVRIVRSHEARLSHLEG
jgi:archaellum component FlaC